VADIVSYRPFTRKHASELLNTEDAAKSRVSRKGLSVRHITGIVTKVAAKSMGNSV
jgi:hypothetical protein